MSCASETYAIVGPRTSLCLIEHSHGEAGPRVLERDIHRTRSREQDGSASRAVPDTTKADPEHIWGDEGPVNE
jgi:hypothetical protein